MSVCSRRLTFVIVYLMFLVSIKLIGQTSFGGEFEAMLIH